MALMSAILQAMIERSATSIAANAAGLCALDQAIGDGDHGANMKRGCDALQTKSANIATLPIGQALTEMGRTLIMTVGGAAGPLYGSFLLGAGAAVEQGQRLPDNLAEVFAAGVAAVEARGRSTAGEKTMLDVLVPVLKVLQCEAGRPALLGKVKAIARESAELTAPMVATKGRAAYLGPRSAGHVDPGAMSSCLIVEAVCESLEAGL